MNFLYAFSNQSKKILFVEATGLVAIIGLLDYWTGSEISFSIFYLIPIGAIAWGVGRNAGVVISFESALAWLFADLSSDNRYSNAVIPYWNGTMRLGIFMLVTLLLSALKDMYLNMEDRVTKKTMDLTVEIEVRKRLEELHNRVILELKDTIQKVNTLQGLLPICAWCKKVRNDDGYWQQVEVYVAERSNADFSHGICPECAAKQLSDVSKRRP